MIFNDTTNKNGAIQFCEDWLFGGDYGAISGNSTQLLKFTNLINRGLDKYKTLGYKVDGRWGDDDPNFTDIPEATTDLSDGVAIYRLDRSHLIVEGFEVKNANGDYFPLANVDYQDIRENGMSNTSYAETDGTPREYSLKGDIVTLRPAPATGSVTMDEGLKIIYKREPDYHTSTDTSVEIGVPRTWQDIPCLFACQEYSKMNTMSEKSREIDAEIAKRSFDLQEYLASRKLDQRTILKVKHRNYE